LDSKLQSFVQGELKQKPCQPALEESMKRWSANWGSTGNQDFIAGAVSMGVATALAIARYANRRQSHSLIRTSSASGETAGHENFGHSTRPRRFSYAARAPAVTNTLVDEKLELIERSDCACLTRFPC
jgi:hypothetical protein